jgi:prepilin-type N-terminal cleavage/methylation domain-containing protein
MTPVGTRSAHHGFTLVEMIVAVTIVLMMMMMFAQVFEVAADINTKVRGLSRNDQRSRLVSTIIVSDLEKRTFRTVIPFASGETTAGRDRDLENRQGYLYISENDPDDDADDVLQLTVRADLNRKNNDQTPYYGLVRDPSGSTTFRRVAGYNRQQTPNSANGAEVSYFLRNGVLYRRVMLLYEAANGRQQPIDDSIGAATRMFDPNHPTPYLPAGTGNGYFWRDFDFSAHYTSTGARLHTRSSFSNDVTSVYPLGRPVHRFGHSHVKGSPCEYIWGPGPDGLHGSNDDRPFFIGRYTHEETSHSNFTYPQYSGFDPMANWTQTRNQLAVGSDGVVGAAPSGLGGFRGGPRRGQDILMTGVHSFDIKVWDDQWHEFVDVGHNRKINVGSLASPRWRDYGLYNYNLSNNTQKPIPQNNNPSPTLSPTADYGPGGTVRNRVFDTWHPSQTAPPPFRPTYLQHYVRLYGASPVTPVPVWKPNTQYLSDSYVFPPRELGGRLLMKCAQSGTSSVQEPDWPSTEGASVQEPPYSMNTPGPIWQVINNWLPLRAIQVTIRFRDQTSGLMRQLTCVHSLLD